MIKGKVEYKNTLNTTFIILFILRRDIPIKLLKRMMIPLSQSTPSRSFESGKKLLATSSVGGDTSAPKEEKKKAPPDAGEVLKKALRRAGEGGLAGAAAMGINVCALMWIRTTINYQYRYGTGTTEAFKKLYSEGGIPRFYRGLIPALVQGPLSRFGDTAANTGTLALLDSIELTEGLPVGVKTVAASVGAALFRILLMPVDTFKTTM